MNNAHIPDSRINPYMDSRKKKISYAKGGLQEIYNFLYEDEDESKSSVPTAPTTEDLPETEGVNDGVSEGETEDDQLAMMIATGDFSRRGNPYLKSIDDFTLNTQRKVGKNPYTLNPYLQETNSEILGSKGVTNLGAVGDVAHQSRQSDHNPDETGMVNAQDYGVSSPEIGSQIVSKLQSEAGDRNVKYIIYNGRIWNPSVSNDWRKYTGPDPHTTHVHVSYNR